MSDFYNEVNALINGIVEGKISKEEAKATINTIKKQYGDDAFPPFDFVQQPKPWNKEYLQHLKTKNVTGACSEDFIIHMAEVSEYVSSKKKRTIIGVAIVILLVIAIIGLLSMSNKKEKSNDGVMNSEIHSIHTNSAGYHFYL